MQDSDLDSSGGMSGQGSPSGPTGPTFDQVNADYQKYLGRSLSQDEYDQYWKNRYDYNSGLVANSAEGLALANKNVPGTPGYDPNATVAPGNQTGQGATPPPSTTSGPPGGNVSTIGNLTAPFTGVFTPPPQQALPTLPQFNAPTYTPPPAFTPPTAAEAQNDPGYQFTLGQGLQALKQGRAAQGLFASGATGKALEDYGQAAATTQYGNVFNRGLQTYLTNLQSQYTQPYEYAYRAAYDAYQPQLTGYQTTAAAAQRANEFDYNSAWNRYLQDINNFRDQRDSTWNKYFSAYTA